LQFAQEHDHLPAQGDDMLLAHLHALGGNAPLGIGG